VNYTLITGASKGIGKAIAREAANRGMNLLLVARSRELLEQLASELSSKNISVKIFPVDLLQDDAPQKIFNFAKENSMNINMLVNNAGIGFMNHFTETELQGHMDVMKLNMDLPVRMTYEFLKTSDPTQRRYIMNSSSTGAYIPVPAINIYIASKSFILFFTRALRQELKKKNVYVTTLCPGPTKSDFFEPANMTHMVKNNQGAMMEPEKVAKAGLDGLLKNKSVVIPGFLNKLGVIACRILPHDLLVMVIDKFYVM
jgi:short-subunit dehydrogenase